MDRIGRSAKPPASDSTRSRRRARRERQSGQAMVIIAFAMIALAFIVAIAADGTRIYVFRRDLIRIADGAVIAGASGMSASVDVSDATRQARARARAEEYVRINGLDPTLTGNALSVTFPSVSPPRKLVNVAVTQTVPTVFGQLLGVSQVTITSGDRQAEAAAIDLVLVLDRSGSMCSRNYSYFDCDTLSGPSTPYSSNTYGGVSGNYTPANPTNYSTSTPNVPWLPFAEVQADSQFFIDQLDPRYDQLAVVSFANTATLEARLSTNYNLARNSIGLSPTTSGTRGVAGIRPLNTTATATALQAAINELLSFPPSGNARSGAVGAIILLSDGAPTQNLGGAFCFGGCSAARQDVMTQAQAASDAGITVYTIFFEDIETEAANGGMLQYVADLTDDHVLQGTYALPGSGTLITPSPTQNYFVARDATSLHAAFQAIANRVYTRITR